MKNISKLAFILLFLPLFAFAEMKIAVIDIQGAILTSDEAKEFVEKVKKELSPDAEKIANLEKEGKKLQERMKTDAAIMSGEEKKKLGEQIEEKAVSYKYLVGKFQNAQKEKQQELVKLMNPKVEAAVKQVLQEGQYDLVLQKQALLFSKPELEITSKVVELLNKNR